MVEMKARLIEAGTHRILIEPATWRDLNALRHLERVCFPKDAWPLLDLIGILTFPNVVRLKAVVGGEMVGFVAADVKRLQGLAWIATIGVLPEYRRRGIGNELLIAVEGLVDVPRIRLSVRVSNEPAIRLYEQLGYVRYDTWPAYYQDGEAAIVLQKDRQR
jgi:ribosomal protein S18 acetylase RimI-like enzyme